MRGRLCKEAFERYLKNNGESGRFFEEKCARDRVSIFLGHALNSFFESFFSEIVLQIDYLFGQLTYKRDKGIAKHVHKLLLWNI